MQLYPLPFNHRTFVFRRRIVLLLSNFTDVTSVRFQKQASALLILLALWLAVSLKP